MLEFKLLNETESYVEYKYFPEGKEEYGIVRYDKINKKFSVIKYAYPHDKPGFSFYTLPLFSRIRKYAAEGCFQEEGMVAWY